MKSKKQFALSSLVILAFGLILGVRTLTSFGANSPVSNSIPGQYIIVFKDTVDDAVAVSDEFTRRHGLGKLETYTHALKGFAATVPNEKLNVLRKDPRVAFVSEDRVVTTSEKKGSLVTVSSIASTQGQQVPTGIMRIDASTNPNKGAVGVAVIDTGVDLKHPDLAANILSGKTCIKATRSATDDNGHGTHVAGTIAALDNGLGVVGVAPQTKIIPVKVLDKSGSGTWSSVICGIDWITANASKLNIKVANMSLGGGGGSDNNCGNANSDALHKAICRMRDAGVTTVVAAGNEGTDASLGVPAAYDDSVITVSALADSDGKASGLGGSTPYGADDTFASFSNYGNVVDIGAPGVTIFSTWKGGAYATLSGTSMATPHTAGAAALYITSNPNATWTQVRDALRTQGETLGLGHTDPSGLHQEPILKAPAL